MFFLFILAILVLVGFDQMCKYFIFFNLQENQSVKAIDGILNFTFVTNTGAAFGIFSSMRWIILLGPILIILCILYFLSAKKIYHWTGSLSAILIIAGGLGNLIDRLSIGYVIDFIDVNPLLEHVGLYFSIFNFADCCICVGAVLMAIYMIFIHDKHLDKKDSLTEKGSIYHA